MKELLVQAVLMTIAALREASGGSIDPEHRARIHNAALQDADDAIAVGEAKLKELGYRGDLGGAIAKQMKEGDEQ